MPIFKVGRHRLTGDYVICRDDKIIDICKDASMAYKRRDILQGLINEKESVNRQDQLDDRGREESLLQSQTPKTD